MRNGLAVALRVLLSILAAIAFGAWAAALATRCTVVPIDPPRPRVGCRWDALRRFQYVLIVERDGPVTRYVLRQPLSAAPDPGDRDERAGLSIQVRPGYCPDEQERLFGRELPPPTNPQENRR